MINNLFYGFRGSILFPDQSSIYNSGLLNDSKSKNSIFRSFFNIIEDNKKFESQYQSRIYYLIFKNKYDDILHCQLARKKQFSKRELIENDIIEKDDEDYPYVNIFIDLVGQKFLIESNTQVFENYNTCSNVIENIINSKLKEQDIRIELNPIIEEENFWNYFSGNSKIYNIEFNLVAPNIFDAEDDANTFLKEAQKNLGASVVNLNFCNQEGELKPNKVGIDSYIKYISDGGGSWKITALGDDGKKVKISSKHKSTKVNIPLTYDELKKDSLDKEQILKVIASFNSIESVEKLKENV